jgi:hypothetical protein
MLGCPETVEAKGVGDFNFSPRRADHSVFGAIVR